MTAVPSLAPQGVEWRGRSMAASAALPAALPSCSGRLTAPFMAAQGPSQCTRALPRHSSLAECSPHSKGARIGRSLFHGGALLAGGAFAVRPVCTALGFRQGLCRPQGQGGDRGRGRGRGRGSGGVCRAAADGGAEGAAEDVAPRGEGAGAGEPGAPAASAAGAPVAAGAPAASSATASVSASKAGPGRPGRKRKDAVRDKGAWAMEGEDPMEGIKDLRYFLSWEWADVAEVWAKSGVSAEQMESEEMQKVGEWFRECRRYWRRDGRLDGMTLDDVIELLRRWELDSFSAQFETILSPEMEFALESVKGGADEETLVGMDWMDALTPEGLQRFAHARAMARLGQGPPPRAGMDADVDPVGLGAVGSVGLPTDRDVPAALMEVMGGEGGEEGRGYTDMIQGQVVEEGEGAAPAGEVGRMPAFELVPPRDWPPPGWEVDADELAFIHGAPNAELAAQWATEAGAGAEGGGPASAEAGGEQEEQRQFPRWNLFMKQYREWLSENRERLDYEALVADPIYYPGRRRQGERYTEGMLELPAIERGQVYAGKVTTVHLNEGLFVNIGAVHDGWMPIYNDDWFKIRDILTVGSTVLVQVLAKRDPFRHRFPIQLRLLQPNLDHLIWRRQPYPPHAPIFARQGDHNLDELARETGRPLLPIYSKVHFANRWERLFVDEMEVDQATLEAGGGVSLAHPYLGALQGVEEVEQMLLARARQGEPVGPLLVHQLLPQPEDAALLDLRLAEEDERVRAAREAQAQASAEEAAEAEGGGEGGPATLGGGEEGGEGEMEGLAAEGVPGAGGGPARLGPVPLTRFEAMRERLQAQHDRRAAEEADALSRDVAMRRDLGLPLAEPGRTPDEIIQQISKTDERNNFIAFLFLAIDLKLFPEGIPDTRELRAGAGEDGVVDTTVSATAGVGAGEGDKVEGAEESRPFIAEDY